MHEKESFMAVPTQHSVSVAAIVVNDLGQVLMTQRHDNGHWEPPGGVLERDESILEGLRREVLEETGVTIVPERLTGVYKNMVRNIVALVFRARIVGGMPYPTSEAQRVEWWSPAEIATGQIDEAYRVRIQDALGDSEPAIRAHDGVNLLPDTLMLPN